MFVGAAISHSSKLQSIAEYVAMCEAGKRPSG